MNKELAFAKKLEEIRALAKEQGNILSQEQVETAFAEIDISKEQLEPVFAYLKSKNIGIGEPVDLEEVLSKEDKDYLTEYVESLKELSGDEDADQAAGKEQAGKDRPQADQGRGADRPVPAAGADGGRQDRH